MKRKVWDIQKQAQIDMPPDMARFLDEIEMVCRKYGFVFARNDFGGLSVRELTEESIRNLLISDKEYGPGVDYVGILSRYSFVSRAYLVFGNELCVDIEGNPGLDFFGMTEAFGEAAPVWTVDVLQEKYPKALNKARLIYERSDVC